VGLHNQIGTALSVKVAAIGGMAGCSATPVDSIPNTPYGVVGPPSGRLEQGNWETINAIYPLRIYIGRTSDAARTQTDANDFLDLFIAAMRVGITLGIAGVSAALLDSWNSDRFYSVGGEDYQAVDASVRVEIDQPESYTA